MNFSITTVHRFAAITVLPDLRCGFLNAEAVNNFVSFSKNSSTAEMADSSSSSSSLFGMHHVSA